MRSSAKFSITVGARDSSLSKIQVLEVLQELRPFYPHLFFNPLFVKTRGDKDLKTPLSHMGKIDFFTDSIDAMQQQNICRIGIHSAKDLPDPLPKGLTLAALTEGKDPSD